MTPQGTEQSFRFGAFELDLRAGELRRGGIRLPVQGRPVQALAVLVRNPGQLVTREQLRQELWPEDTFVDFEHGLHNAVARIRSVLGDTAGTPRYIETLPRRGYRFIAPVDSGAAVQQAPEPSTADAPVPESVPLPEMNGGRAHGRSGRRTLAIAAITTVMIGLVLVLWRIVPSRLGSAAGTTIDSVAVLPLQNLSADPEQEYFADGTTEALITELSHIKALRVISRTSIVRYKGTKKTSPEIARELGVRAILEGAVEKAGDRVRISARLVRASDDQPVWAESYDRELRDILRIQADVAQSIARQIRIEVTPEERAHLTAARQLDPDAWQSYLKGRYFWEKRSRDSVYRAIQYFNHAIEKDPSFAAAYSGLADCYSSLGFSFDVADMPPREVQPKAIRAASRAIALDPSLSEAHTSLAFIKLTYDWDWINAEKEFRRGLALNPNAANGHHWYSHYLMASGRIREAAAESRRALELDPLNLVMNVHLGWHLFYARQYDEALEQLRKSIEIEPNYGLAHWYSGLVYEQQRRFDDALRELKRAKELLPENAIIDSDIGHVYAVAGRRQDALVIVDRIAADSARRYVSSFEPALIHAGLGEKDKALSEMRHAFDEHSDMLVYLGVDPRLDSLRSDPRFQELLRAMSIPR